MDYESKEDGYYSNVRDEMLDFLPKSAKIILDVGCADGSFSKIVKERNKAEVWGMEYMPKEAKKASLKIDNVLTGSCEGNILFLFTALDMRYLQFATVAKKKGF